MKTAVIFGYYGFDNLGDDLLLRVLCHGLIARNICPVVLSRHPQKTRQQFAAWQLPIQAIGRLDVRAIHRAIKQATWVLGGGGGLLQDATGPNSILYYGGLMQWARLYKKPVLLLGQGVGPINRPWLKFWAKWALGACQAIAVRDASSLALVEQLLPKNVAAKNIATVIKQTEDWVWQLPQVIPQPVLSAVNKPVGLHIAISLRPWKTFTPQALQKLAQTCYRLSQTWAAQTQSPHVHWWLLPFEPNSDTAVLSQFQEALYHCQHPRLKSEVPVSCYWVNPAEVFDQLSHCHALIGMRFHSLVLGLLAGLPCWGLSYDAKVSQLCQRANVPMLPVDKLQEALLIDAKQQAVAEEVLAAWQAKPNASLLEQFAEASEGNWQFFV